MLQFLIDIHILPLLILIPLVGAIATFLMGKHVKASKYVALIFSGVTLVLATLLLLYTNLSKFGINDYQYLESYNWISALGINFIVGVDGISVPMVWLSALLCFLAILFSWDVTNRTKEYMGLMLVLEVGVMGVFMSLDYFMFYVFWEIVLIPMFFLISIWGGPRREYAAIKFFIYTHIASLVMLLAIFALYFQAGLNTFDMRAIQTVAPLFAVGFQIVVFAAFFFGFGVKMPVVPFHTWLPDAHVEAPTAGSVLLAGLLLKMGSYGLLRVALPTLPSGAQELQWLLLTIAILSILYGAFASLAQKDLKKMVAFSSISHMGMVLLGIATLGTIGIAAGAFQMFAHGLITAVLFMVCGVVQHKAGTREISKLGGLAIKLPWLATFMMIGFMASLGLPGLVGFAAEFTVFFATWQTWQYLLLIPIASVAITAAYYIWAMQRTIFGPLTDKIDTSHLKDVNWYEAAPLAALCILIILFGLFPGAMFDIIRPAADAVAHLFPVVI
ncbi:MAG: NuoM family protein [Methanomassiliicoccales archaeon]|nr:NuoM family protein [Methanomassiliicoccales archaeon]